MSATKRVSGDYAIKTVGSGSTIRLVSERVVSDSHLELKKLVLEPTTTPEYSTLFAAETGAAGSGIFVINDSGADELVSKKRAILFSLLF
jgi:hypothetical protein